MHNLQILQLAAQAYAVALQGGKLSEDEAKYFKKFIRKLDFDQCYLILEMVSNRHNQQTK